MIISPTYDILGIIDVQPDFMPGGSLPVPGGDEVIAPINALLHSPFRQAFATQDWHPADHISFAHPYSNQQAGSIISTRSGPQKIWPPHTIMGTSGAKLHPDLNSLPIHLIIRKGWRKTIDSYSAFFENDHTTPTGLASALREIGIKRIFLCGLAFDVCITASAIDARKAGFETFILTWATRSIATPLQTGSFHTTEDEAKYRLQQAGVVLLDHL